MQVAELGVRSSFSARYLCQINCVAELMDHLALKLTYRPGNSIFFDEFKSIIKTGPMRLFWATTRLLKPISRGDRADRNLRPENHDSISTCFVSEHFPCSKIDLEFSVFDILNQF